jgi:hypothetical protein
MIFLEPSPEARVEFRVDDEVASIVDGEARREPVESPHAIVSADRAGFYHLIVDRDLSCVAIDGDEPLVRSLIASLPYAEPSPAAVAATAG